MRFFFVFQEMQGARNCEKYAPTSDAHFEV